MNIIDLLVELETEDLVIWRNTLDGIADSLQYELKEAVTEELVEKLEEDLDSICTLNNFLRMLGDSLDKGV